MSKEVTFKKTCNLIFTKSDEEEITKSSDALDLLEAAAKCIQGANPGMSLAKCHAEAYARHPNLYALYAKLAKEEILDGDN